MAGKTNISWATHVWNPSVGCTRVSSGCSHCYAFALHDRWYAANLKATDEISIVEPRPTGSERIALVRQVEPTALPFPAQYDLPFSKVQLLPDRLDAPLRWKKPRRIFVDSMSDLFHEDVPDEFIDRVFATMAMAPRHTFLILTKRPERMRDYAGNEARPVHFSSGDRSIADASTATKVLWAAQEMCEGGVPYKEYPNGIDMEWPLPNVWLGVSVEDQATADERIPLLLRTPAAVRFASAEPLLGPVNVCLSDTQRCWCGEIRMNCDCPRIDWLIVGGETGKGWRPMNLDWARSLRDQCQAAGVPYFYKQGSGSQPGKHRILDGRTWEEMPC